MPGLDSTKKPNTGVWMWLGGIDAEQIDWDLTFKQPNTFPMKTVAFYTKTTTIAWWKCSVRPTVLLHDKLCSGASERDLGRSYWILQNSLYWSGKSEQTERMNSALLEITQAETEYVWTGLRYLVGDWFWVNGDDLNNTAWYQNEQPQCPARDLRCGALDKETKLWTNRTVRRSSASFVSRRYVPWMNFSGSQIVTIDR